MTGDSVISNISPLAEIAAGEPMLEDSGAQKRSVLNVHEDSSTESPPQLQAAVELCKRSIPLRLSNYWVVSLRASVFQPL